MCKHDTDGFVSTSTAALRCFRLRVCVSSASSVSSLISNEVTSNDDCLDLPPSSLPNLAILERSLSPLPACCSSQPAFERSREKGHAMLSSMQIPLLEGMRTTLYNCVARWWIRIVRLDSIKLNNGHKARVTRHSHVYQRSAVQLTPTLPSLLPLLSSSTDCSFNVPLTNRLSCLVLVSANPLASLPLEFVPGQTPAATTVHPRAPGTD